MLPTMFVATEYLEPAREYSRRGFSAGLRVQVRRLAAAGELLPTRAGSEGEAREPGAYRQWIRTRGLVDLAASFD